MVNESTVNTYYAQGWHAYHVGAWRTSNPYSEGEPREMWFAGWDAAEKQDQKAKVTK